MIGRDSGVLCTVARTLLTGMQEMKRALFVYAKLNPGIKYVQGMNEIYAPIYYQFATDTDKSAAIHAEADAFFCFVELISEFRDHFCQHLVSTFSAVFTHLVLRAPQDDILFKLPPCTYNILLSCRIIVQLAYVLQ